MNYIQKTQMKVGRAYFIDGKYLTHGIWTGNDFVGVIWKMGHPVTAHENHFDQGPRVGSAKPIRELK